MFWQISYIAIGPHVEYDYKGAHALTCLEIIYIFRYDRKCEYSCNWCTSLSMQFSELYSKQCCFLWIVWNLKYFFFIKSTAKRWIWRNKHFNIKAKVWIIISVRTTAVYSHDTVCMKPFPKTIRTRLILRYSQVRKVRNFSLCKPPLCNICAITMHL